MGLVRFIDSQFVDSQFVDSRFVDSRFVDNQFVDTAVLSTNPFYRHVETSGENITRCSVRSLATARLPNGTSEGPTPPNL